MTEKRQTISEYMQRPSMAFATSYDEDGIVWTDIERPATAKGRIELVRDTNNPKRFYAHTDSDVWVTDDITAQPVQWRKVE